MNVIDQATGEAWVAYNGDAVEVLASLPERCIDMAVFSPPFSNLYSYSPSDRDMGNTRDDAEFFAHHRFLTDQLTRVMKPGRILAVHLQNLPLYETKDGVTGRRDFRGAFIRHMVEEGFVYQSEITINKNPQTQAIRNHPKGLLFVQLRRDSSWMWQAYADYICVFRTPGKNEEPVHTDITEEDWIAWAAPVWNDIRETDVLPLGTSKADDDERHLAPLQISVAERCIRLWCNPGDTVLSPFMGIGSEGYAALKVNRRFIGVELKPEYFGVAVRNLRQAEEAGATARLL